MIFKVRVARAETLKRMEVRVVRRDSRKVSRTCR